MVFLVSLFYRQCLPNDMRLTNGAVVHIQMNLLSQKLTIVVPDDGILIHGHARVLRTEHQRVAYCLKVFSVHPYLMICVHLAVHGVGIDMKGEQLQRITMHVQSVLL